MYAISCSATRFLFIYIVPQADSFAIADSEEAFTTFANACAQAGAAKCLPAGMIQGSVTGSDVRQLFTSTIDVSPVTPAYISRNIELEPTARLEVTEGRIYRTPSTKWGA